MICNTPAKLPSTDLSLPDKKASPGRWFPDRTFSDEMTAMAGLPGSAHTYRIIAFGPDNMVQSTTPITVMTPDGWDLSPSTGSSSTSSSAGSGGTTE